MEGVGRVGGWEMVERKRLEEEEEAWPPKGEDRFGHVHGVVIYGVSRDVEAKTLFATFGTGNFDFSLYFIQFFKIFREKSYFFKLKIFCFFL